MWHLIDIKGQSTTIKKKFIVEKATILGQDCFLLIIGKDAIYLQDNEIIKLILNSIDLYANFSTFLIIDKTLSQSTHDICIDTIKDHLNEFQKIYEFEKANNYFAEVQKVIKSYLSKMDNPVIIDIDNIIILDENFFSKREVKPMSQETLKEMNPETFKNFKNELEAKCKNRLEKATINKYLKQNYIFDAPEKNEDFFDNILQKISPNTLNYDIVEYILALFGGFTENHDLTKGKVIKILVMDNDDNVILFLYKIIFQNKPFFLFIQGLESSSFHEYLQISDILKLNGFSKNLTVNISQDYQDIQKAIGDKKGIPLLNYLNSKRDAINLINIAQRQKQTKKLMMDYSTELATPLLWTTVLYLFSNPLKNVKSIFIETEDNYLSIRKEIYTFKTIDYPVIHLLNLKSFIPEQYFLEFSDEILKKIFELAKKG